MAGGVDVNALAVCPQQTVFEVAERLVGVDAGPVCGPFGIAQRRFFLPARFAERDFGIDADDARYSRRKIGEAETGVLFPAPIRRQIVEIFQNLVVLAQFVEDAEQALAHPVHGLGHATELVAVIERDRRRQVLVRDSFGRFGQLV